MLSFFFHYFPPGNIQTLASLSLAPAAPTILCLIHTNLSCS